MTRDKDLQDSTKAVALVFLQAMDAAAKVVSKHDMQAQYFLECVRDELAPQLKWAFRYGAFDLEQPPFRPDDEPSEFMDELDTEPEV